MSMPIDSRCDRLLEHVYSPKTQCAPKAHPQYRTLKKALKHLGRILAHTISLERKYDTFKNNSQFHELEELAKHILELSGYVYVLLTENAVFTFMPNSIPVTICIRLLPRYTTSAGLHITTYYKNKFLSGEFNSVTQLEDLTWEKAEMHLVHVSTTNYCKVAYHRSWVAMYENRQTVTSIEKFATEFLSDVLSAVEIRDLGLSFACTQQQTTLTFIENDDPDGWVTTYACEKHTTSCMSSLDCVRVYAYPGNGLRLAVLHNNHNEVIARAIVRDIDAENRGYLRIYPDPTSSSAGILLKTKLATAGYVEEINLDGVKVQKINNDYGIVMPYIDRGDCGSQTAEECYTHMLLGTGDFDCDNTDGYCTMPEETTYCESCNEYVPDDDMMSVEHENYTCVCSSCCDMYYTLATIRDNQFGYAVQEYVHDDEIVRSAEGTVVSKDYAVDNYTWCELSEQFCESTNIVLDEYGDELFIYDGLSNADLARASYTVVSNIENESIRDDLEDYYAVHSDWLKHLIEEWQENNAEDVAA